MSGTYGFGSGAVPDGVMTFGRTAVGISDPIRLGALFATHLEQFGIEGFGYTQVNEVGQLDRRRNLVTWPQALVDYYYDNDCPEIDLTFQLGRTLFQPFQWSRTFDRATADPRFNEMMDASADYGQRDGITITIPGIRGCAAFVDFTINRNQRALNETFQWHLGRLQTVALEFHSFMQPLFDARDRRLAEHQRLTERERECFQWIARGKSCWEIGCILAISERTVMFHINNVKRKLKAATRIQALVQLVLAGEIDP